MQLINKMAEIFSYHNLLIPKSIRTINLNIDEHEDDIEMMHQINSYYQDLVVDIDPSIWAWNIKTLNSYLRKILKLLIGKYNKLNHVKKTFPNIDVLVHDLVMESRNSNNLSVGIVNEKILILQTPYRLQLQINK